MATLGLSEPIKQAIIDRLETDVPAVVDELNAESDDGYDLRHPALILPMVPSLGVLREWPTIGIPELPGKFEDDIGSSAVAVVDRVIAFDQSPDLLELGWRLTR